MSDNEKKNKIKIYEYSNITIHRYKQMTEQMHVDTVFLLTFSFAQKVMHQV